MLRKPFDGEYRITQKFGENPSYYSQFGFAGHEGVDYATPTGTPILSCEAGKIVRRNDVKDGAYGIYVVVWHEALNLATWYCHLQENLVSIGDQVIKGQRIATADNTGNTTGPHLHLNLCETDANGYRINQDNGYKGFIDPLPYIDNSTTTIPAEIQKIIDGLRGERDHNWDLYQSEKQITAELTAQLKACQEEQNKYKEAIIKWANTLSVNGTTEAITIAINTLLEKEDGLRKCQTDLKDKGTEIGNLQKEIEIITAEKTNLSNKLETSDTNLKTCQTEKGTMYTQLTKCQTDLANTEKPDPNFFVHIARAIKSYFERRENETTTTTKTDN